MTNSFLTRFLHVAHKITRAERGLAVNTQLEVISNVNIDAQTLEDQTFRQFSQMWLQRALDDGQTIITNNIITDPAHAPITNTNFANLRVIVCIPVKNHGGIYLDQHIRNGIIPREIIDRISNLLASLQQNQQEHLSETEIQAVYDKLG